MPYLKPISGHTSCAHVKRYLERAGRDLATDLVNLCEDWEGSDWAKQMDQTRRYFDNDKPHGGKRARTYNHYVLSPDPKDSISLEDFRAFMMEFLERAFEERFEIAVVYHDDNEGHILHAHFIVNNTDLTTGKRLAPWLTGKKVREISKLCEDMAKERGWGNFLGKMQEDLRRAEVEKAGRLEVEERAFSGFSLDEADKADEPEAVPFMVQRDAYYTKAEREILEKEGWSWKEDIRARVRIARELSVTEEGFLRALSILDVQISTTAKGDYRYVHPDDPRWQVNGHRLGRGYSRDGVRRLLADEGARKVAKPASMERARIMEAFDAWRIEGIRTIGYIHPRLGISLADVAEGLRVANELDIRSASGLDRAIGAAEGADLLRLSATRDLFDALGADLRSARAHKGRAVTRPELAIEQMGDAEARRAIEEARRERMKDAPKKPKRTEERRGRKGRGAKGAARMRAGEEQRYRKRDKGI